MQTLTKKLLTLSALAAILTLSACGGTPGGGAQSSQSTGATYGSGNTENAFDKYLTGNDLMLPSTIPYKDFDDACRRRGLLKSEEYLQSIGIAIKGSGDNRYLSGSDLRQACGKTCNPTEGLGDLLTDLTTYNITNR